MSDRESALLTGGRTRRSDRVDHIVSTASARARGAISDVDRDAVRRSFDMKVIGPLMLARAFLRQITNGAADTLTRPHATRRGASAARTTSPRRRSSP